MSVSHKLILTEVPVCCCDSKNVARFVVVSERFFTLLISARDERFHQFD